jgi:dihydroorotate dehydrogenase
VLAVLRRLDPERAHRLALYALRLGLAGRAAERDDPALAVRVLGLSFTNPIGLAAGFDKDAVAARPLARLGFGFVETGTVTPRPQTGNPRPRIFRLEQDRAVINRLGFNNRGIAEYCERLTRLAPKPRRVPIGANLGINKEGADPERDYPALVAAVAPHADYIVINVSSPNTPGLRDLQSEARLSAMLQAIAAAVAARPPLLVKLSPDLADAALQRLVEMCLAAGVDGLVISNTTIARPRELRSSRAAEAGGLSGVPLFRRSTGMLARARLIAGGRLVLIGCGGIASGSDVLTKIEAGANLVQLYTAFAYDGPPLIPRLKRQLLGKLRAQGFGSVGEAVGVAAEQLAEWG